MKSYLISRLSRIYHVALVLTAFSLFGATIRCAAQTSTLPASPTFRAHLATAKAPPAPSLKLTSSRQSLSMWSMATDTDVVTATPQGGVTVPSNSAPPTLAGVPTGIAASWSAPTVSAAGAVSWTLTLTGSVNAVASTDTLNLSITAGGYSASVAVPLTVSFTQPTLNFSAAQTHLPVIQGGQVSDLFTFVSGGSFHGTLTLTITGLPSSVAYSWSNAVTLSANTASATLTLAPSATTTVAWSTVTVTAQGDGMTLSRNFTLEMEPATGVQTQVSSPVVRIEPQGTATLTVTATPINGIKLPAGAVGASAAITSQLPAGVTASWSSPSVTAKSAAAWTLTLSANGAATAGDYPVNLSAQIADSTTGLVYTASQSFTLLTSLLANVSVGATPGISIPTTFMGLAHEWNDGQWEMGSSATGVNSIYRQLLTNLTAYGSGPINIRIGGDSTDHSGTATPTTVAPFAQLNTALGSQFELGVNLGSNKVAIAVQQAQVYSNPSNMPAGSLLALEIGNEVDLYPQNGLRPKTYNLQNYLTDFNNWKQGVVPVASGVGLAGPVSGEYFFGTSGATAASSYAANMQTFIAKESSVLSVVTQHQYGTQPAVNPAPDFLLTPAAATYGPTLFAPAVQAAQAHGLPFRMGEVGPESDGGRQGVSNTFASALWAVDNMFNYANIGVVGMNWHTSSDYTTPFYFTSTYANGVNTYALSLVSPLYYGLLFFQAAVGDGSQMLPVNLATSANLTAWATLPASSKPRLAIINKDEAQSGDVSITMPGYSQATVLFLTAPSYKSTNGVTFAGQTMDGSTDGRLQGNQTEQTIEGSGGVFQLSMPITSAAIVVFTN